MKRALALVVAAMLLALMLPLSTVSAQGTHDPGNGHGDKITVCHNVGHHPVTISKKAWPAHKRHGDTLGACAGGTVKPPKPSSPAVCTFHAGTSASYSGATNASALAATGPIHFSWTVATGVVSTTGGFWHEMAPPPPAASVTYLNNVTAGTVSAAGAVTLSFVRTIPNGYSFGFTGTLAGSVLSGKADGTFFTATGTSTCNNGHTGDQVRIAGGLWRNEGEP
jgi:hypothetical protein